MELEALFFFVGGGIPMMLMSISWWELLPPKHTLLSQKKNWVSMQRIKKRVWELEWMKEKGGNHLKCCCGSISEVMVKKKKKSESQNGALKNKNEKA